MTNYTKEEIDQAAIKYLELKNKAETGTKSDKLRFDAYKNIFVRKINGIVLHHTKRYKKFSNYSDLQQDAFEAALKSLDSFNPEQGSFCWWVNRYVKTKVQRKANKHSTIKIPLKKAKDIKPYKISKMPVRIDTSLNPLEIFEISQDSENIKTALMSLPEEQRKVISMRYGFFGIQERSVLKILEDMSLTRNQYSKLLSDAKLKIKKHLMRVEE